MRDRMAVASQVDYDLCVPIHYHISTENLSCPAKLTGIWIVVATALQRIRKLGKHSTPEKRDDRIQRYHWTRALHGMTPYIITRMSATQGSRTPVSISLARGNGSLPCVVVPSHGSYLFCIFVTIEIINFQPQLATTHTRLPFTL